MKTLMLLLSFMLIGTILKAQTNSLVYKEIAERTDTYDSASATWSFSDSENFSYDANARHTATTDFTYSSGVWNKNTLSSFSWDAKENLSNFLIQSWVSYLNDWRNESQFVNTFNGAGDQIGSLYQQWDSASNTWVNLSGYQYQKTYNAGNEISDEVNQSLNSVTHGWDNTYHYINTFDTNGLPDTTITQTWYLGKWQNNSKVSFTYDKNNYLIQILCQVWDSAVGSWFSPGFRTGNTYDADGNLLTKANFVWNRSTATWDPYENRYTYMYTGNHLRTSELIEFWDTATRKYYVSSSITQTYDVKGNNTRYESSGSRYTYSYDANNNKTYFLNENYNPANHIFTPVRRTYYYYQAFNVNSVNETKNELDVSLYPNPTTGIITVHNSKENIQRVSLRNILGEKVLEITEPNTSEFTLNLSKFPVGMYIATFVMPNSVITKKIIRE